MAACVADCTARCGKVVKMSPMQGFSASMAGASILTWAEHNGMPVSTTHCVTGCVLGAGSAKRLSSVRWNVVGEIVTETIHPQIKMAMERSLPLEELLPHLRRLDIALDAHDARAVRSVLSKVVELDFPAAPGPKARPVPGLSPVGVSTS